MKAVFFNVQTTGLDPEQHEIVSWAAMPWDDGTRGPVRADTFRALGNLDTPATREALAVNGYDAGADALAKLPPLSAGFVQAIFALLSEHEHTLIACNPAFAWAFMVVAARRLGVPIPTNGVRLIDVSSMAFPLMVAGHTTGISIAPLAMMIGKERKRDAPSIVALTCDIFEALFARYWGAIKPVTK